MQLCSSSRMAAGRRAAPVRRSAAAAAARDERWVGVHPAARDRPWVEVHLAEGVRLTRGGAVTVIMADTNTSTAKGSLVFEGLRLWRVGDFAPSVGAEGVRGSAACWSCA